MRVNPILDWSYRFGPLLYAVSSYWLLLNKIRAGNLITMVIFAAASFLLTLLS